MITLLLAAALVTTVTPQGHRLTLESNRFPSWGDLAPARLMGLADGFRYVADHPGNWWKLALEADSAFTWPGRQRVVAVFADSERVACDELWVMSPPTQQRLKRIGAGWDAWVDPGELWRQPYRRRGVATMLFVRFPGTERAPVGILIEGR